MAEGITVRTQAVVRRADAADIRGLGEDAYAPTTVYYLDQADRTAWFFRGELVEAELRGEQLRLAPTGAGTPLPLRLGDEVVIELTVRVKGNRGAAVRVNPVPFAGVAKAE